MAYRTLLCTAAVALALTACGSSKDKAENASAGAGESRGSLGGMKLRAGQWEMTSETLLAEIPGMPPEAAKMMNGQKTTVRTCITPEQAAKSNADLFTARKDNECEHQDWSMGGGKMHGSMVCNNDEGGMMGKMTMKLDGTYGEDNYDLVMDMNIPAQPGGGTMHMKTRVQGKRVGDCA
jgi:hypothetical protein